MNISKFSKKNNKLILLVTTRNKILIDYQVLTDHSKSPCSHSQKNRNY